MGLRSGLASLQSKPNHKSVEGVKSLFCQATTLKHHGFGEDLWRGVGQNTNYSICRPGQKVKGPFDLCHCHPGLHHKEINITFSDCSIFICQNNVKNHTMWFPRVFLKKYSVSHDWSVPMRKITNLSCTLKWVNLQILKVPKTYFLLCVYISIYTVYFMPNAVTA